MAYIDYDQTRNSISLIRGIANFYNQLSYVEADGNFQIIEEEGKFKGIKVYEFLSRLELKGLKAEIKFKNLLENNSIPYLYVGQGPLGIEKSNVLKETTKSKRPDFLVNLPDIGILFFDVKCRQKIGFPRKPSKYFQIFVKEAQGLINLHEQLLISVWIAFYDESNVDKESSDTFYLLPISLLKSYMKSLFQKLGERDSRIVSSLRIS